MKPLDSEGLSDIEEIRSHISDTYFRLRLVMAAMAFCFPFVLLLLGMYLYSIPIQDNMSSYYFAFHPENPVEGGHLFPMRIWFVGFLWAIGFCLIIYRGFSPTEYRLLNLAGLCALGVAILPAWPPEYCAVRITKVDIVLCATSDTTWAHRVLAAGVFACAAYVASFCSVTTLDFVKEQMRPVYRRVYDFLAIIMVISGLGGLAAVFFWPNSGRFVLVIETVGFCTFAIYWLVKTVELKNSQLENDLMKPAEPQSDEQRRSLHRRVEPLSDEERTSVRRRLSRALG